MGADTRSRNPTQSVAHCPVKNMICQVITDHPAESNFLRSGEIQNHVETNIINRISTLNSITNTHCDPLLTQEDIINACQSDQQYQALSKLFSQVSPNSRKIWTHYCMTSGQLVIDYLLLTTLFYLTNA